MRSSHILFAFDFSFGLLNILANEFVVKEVKQALLVHINLSLVYDKRLEHFVDGFGIESLEPSTKLL